MKNTDNKKIGLLNFIAIILSMYVLVALIIQTVFIIPDEISNILDYVDNLICAFFFIEFCINFYKSENKLGFMKWGWIDLVSSIPTIDALRAGRVLRIIKLVRLIKAFRSTRNLMNHIFSSKSECAFTSVAIIAFSVIVFSAIGILQVETDPNSNIKTAEDAIWWAYVTITTVGYGDKYPVTTEGRIIASLLMTVGVGLFGTFTAYVASWFATENKK